MPLNSSRVIENITVALVTAAVIAIGGVASNWFTGGGVVKLLGGVKQSELDTYTTQQADLKATNVALEKRLNCVVLELSPLTNEIDRWKGYMQLTAETTSNTAVRHSRTEDWFQDVDDVTKKISEVVQISNGQRSSC